MKLFRYRRPSLNTLLGITKAKKRVKKELGITAALNWDGFDEVETAIQAKDRL
jgi:hypothetical protein